MSETTERQAELEEQQDLVKLGIEEEGWRDTFGGEEVRDPDELVEQYEATRFVDPIDGDTRRPFEHAAATVADCLDTVRTTLTMLRAQRDDINDEIRLLVAEEELLQRMARITARATTEGNTPHEQPSEDPPG